MFFHIFKWVKNNPLQTLVECKKHRWGQSLTKNSACYDYVVLSDAAGTLTRFHIRDVYKFSGHKIVQTEALTKKRPSFV